MAVTQLPRARTNARGASAAGGVGRRRGAACLWALLPPALHRGLAGPQQLPVLPRPDLRAGLLDARRSCACRGCYPDRARKRARSHAAAPWRCTLARSAEAAAEFVRVRGLYGGGRAGAGRRRCCTRHPEQFPSFARWGPPAASMADLVTRRRSLASGRAQSIAALVIECV